MQELPTVNPVPNPNLEQRYGLVQQALTQGGHPEDFWDMIHLLDPPDFPLPQEIGRFCKGKKIAIVGAGLAGLSAAYELRSLGFSVTLYEQHPTRVGGRVYTYYFEEGESLYGELGAALVPVSHQTTWHYLQLFHLETRPYPMRVSGCLYNRGRRVRSDAGDTEARRQLYRPYALTRWEQKLPWDTWLDVYLMKELLRVPPEERVEILQIRQKDSPAVQQLYARSLEQFLQENQLSSGGQQLLSSLLLRNAAFLPFCYHWANKYTEAFIHPYRIAGGSSRLPQAFYQALTEETGLFGPPVQFCSGMTVTGMEAGAAGVRLLLQNRALQESVSQPYDSVICTVPFGVLRGMQFSPALSPEKLQAIRELPFIPAQRSLLLYRVPFWRSTDITEGLSLTDLPLQRFFYPPDAQAGDPAVLSADSFGADAAAFGAMESMRRRAWLQRQVAAVHGLSPAGLEKLLLAQKSMVWSAAPGFCGAFSALLPGQRERLRVAAVQSEYEGRLLFAGGDIAPLQGWMQGALQSGMLAARETVGRTLLRAQP